MSRGEKERGRAKSLRRRRLEKQLWMGRETHKKRVPCAPHRHVGRETPRYAKKKMGKKGSFGYEGGMVGYRFDKGEVGGLQSN